MTAVQILYIQYIVLHIWLSIRGANIKIRNRHFLAFLMGGDIEISSKLDSRLFVECRYLLHFLMVF